MTDSLVLNSMPNTVAAWLLAPLSGSGEHIIEPWAYWHARFMVMAWAVLLPLGTLAARFYKVAPGQDWPRRLNNKAWWHAHRGLQWAGVLCLGAGLLLIWGHPQGQTTVAQGHAWAGWIVCALAIFQVASGLARGSRGGPEDVQMNGDHYDMTAWRQGFERVHKSLGWLAIVLSVGVVLLGLVTADAPRWMLTLLLLWWALLGAAFAHLQRSGRCVDTYQAIWGPEAQHPGNRRQPIGWGVRRAVLLSANHPPATNAERPTL